MEKEEKKNTKKDKPLYTCDTEVTLEEYKKLVKCYPSFYWIRVFVAAIFALLLHLFIGKGDISTELSIIMYLVVIIIVMIYFKIKINVLIEQSYYRLNKNTTRDINYKIEFYEKYFSKIGKKVTIKEDYSEISRIIETDTNFYIKIKFGNIIIQKEKCDFDTINFIKNIDIDKLEIRDKNNKIIKHVKKNNIETNPKILENRMQFLFILTVLIPFIYGYIMTLIDSGKPTYVEDIGTAICLILLIIPPSSILFGFKYRKEYFGFKKNIIAGIIVGLLLLIFWLIGLFS